jgi:hypothetical protein
MSSRGKEMIKPGGLLGWSGIKPTKRVTGISSYRKREMFI